MPRRCPCLNLQGKRQVRQRTAEHETKCKLGLYGRVRSMGGKRTFPTIRIRTRNLYTPSPAAYAGAGGGAKIGQIRWKVCLLVGCIPFTGAAERAFSAATVRQEPFIPHVNLCRCCSERSACILIENFSTLRDDAAAKNGVHTFSSATQAPSNVISDVCTILTAPEEEMCTLEASLADMPPCADLPFLLWDTCGTMLRHS